MPVYNLEKLMNETRRIAAEYRQSTGSTLPVSAELAKFDAIQLLGLKAFDGEQRAVDAVYPSAQGDLKVQIKGRVIFDSTKTGYRVGQLNLEADWDLLLLVLMNQRYETTDIYRLDKKAVLAALGDSGEKAKRSRGALSVKKFKAIAERCWRRERGAV